MSYPGLMDYNSAMLDPQTAFKDRELSQGEVLRNHLGMPQVLSGGFALTYRIDHPDGGSFAVRCFREERKDRFDAYRMFNAVIAEEQGRHAEHCWVDTVFLGEGIYIDGGSYPIVKMDWVFGKTLSAFIEEHHRDASVMRQLRLDMRSLGAYLERIGVAHGDIQTGNIIRIDGRLKLIDYDGIYVPEMGVRTGSETGHPNFQHPGRTDDDFDSGIDRFSFAIFELSLFALETEPSLFSKFSTGENILFSRSDYLDPDASSLFQALRKKPELSEMTRLFADICKIPPAMVPALDDFAALKPLGTRECEFIEKIHAEEEKKRKEPEKPPVYSGPYAVFSADDYDELNDVVGEKVEVIGCIEEVKWGTSKYGKPYVFINFGFWKDDVFNINIWSEGLDTFARKPSSSWEGQWISVTGLVDEPYESDKFGYTHISITVHDSSQLRLISEEEADFRLGRKGPVSPNRDIFLSARLGELDGGGQRGDARSGAPPASEKAASSGMTLSNKELLRRLDEKKEKKTVTSSGAGSGGSNLKSYYRKKYQSGVSGWKVFFYTLLIFGGLFLIIYWLSI